MTEGQPDELAEAAKTEHCDDGPKSSRDPDVSRRRLLQASAAPVAAGLAGCDAIGLGRDPGPVTEDHDWQPANPPLATPWFEDVSAEDPHPEYPRPQLVRDRWQPLNGVWGFEPANEGDDPPTERQLDEGILVPFPVESALSGIQREEDRMWYRRTFEIPDDQDVRGDERLLLHFEAVDYETTVYVNGQEVGSHVGGYDHFEFDVTDAISGARRQELVVRVHDPTEEGQTLGKQHPNDGPIWYTPTSGIWQSVWLEPVHEAHVTSVDTTLDVDAEALSLTVETTGGSETEVAATAFDGDAEVSSVTGAPGEDLSLPVSDPKLWSPDDPFLYDLEIELRRDGDVVDAVESYFGMRSIGVQRIDGRLRTTLNGEFSFTLATLDQGYWPDGIYTAPTDDALKFDLEKHLDLGFNTVRKHGKIESRRWYYHADRLGLIVHQDMPSTADYSGTPNDAQREQFERELRAMVDQLGSHPSITACVPFNEGWGMYDQERIATAVAEWNPEWLINSNSGGNVDGGHCGCADIVDYHNYPGPGSVPPADEFVSVLGEFGGLGLTVDDHAWQSGSGYSYASYLTSAGLTEAYVGKLGQTQLLMEMCGLSSAVYTQLTDVETENNGLLTYDRKVVKPDADRVREVNERLLAAAKDVQSAAGDGGAGSPELVGHWPLDAGEGGSAIDRSGGNDGPLSGEATWVEGRVGQALSFDGGEVDTGANVLDTLGDYSVAAWVRLADDSRSQAAVSQEGEVVNAFRLGYATDRERFAFAAVDVDDTVDPARAVALDAAETSRWYHLVGVRDAVAGTVRLYVDGERAAEEAFCPGFQAMGPTVIGRGYWDGIRTSYWRGTIDDVRVFDGALGDDAVARLFHAAQS